VTFPTKECVEKALAKNGEYLGQRYLTIEPAKGRRQIAIPAKKINTENIKTATIFVKNLPYELTEDELGDFFAPCGEIEGVRMIYNQSHGHFKGFGYVDFASPEAVKKAVSEFQGKEFKGRKVYIDVSHRPPKHGFRLNSVAEGNEKYNKDQFKILKKKIKKETKERIRGKLRKFHESKKEGKPEQSAFSKKFSKIFARKGKSSDGKKKNKESISKENKKL